MQTASARIILALTCCCACSNAASSDSSGSGAQDSSSSESDSGEMTAAATETSTTSESGSETETGDGPLLDLPEDEELPPGCVQASTDFMFLLDSLGGLHRFDPETLLVEPLGALACPGAVAAFALTIDRGGTLWALMIDDTAQRLLFTIDPETLACELTAFDDPLPAGFAAYALAFAADAVDSPDETLYLAGLLTADLNPSPDAPAGLARIDAQTLAVETVGMLPLPNTPAYELCDLKGSGDARLYAFCSTEPATMAEIDEGDASFLQSEVIDLVIGDSGAFGLWEGEFWLFTSSGPNGNTQARTYTLGSGEANVVIDDLGFIVVGAANSTCVPYEPVG